MLLRDLLSPKPQNQIENLANLAQKPPKRGNTYQIAKPIIKNKQLNIRSATYNNEQRLLSVMNWLRTI